uniref:Putative baseplate protein n=1 Tax=viral metagenome TaxID=1070528 RepID=A0A6M3M4Q6_9ZZZZ
MTYGMTADGYTPRTAAEWLKLFQGDYEARLLAAGLPSNVDWDRDAIEGIFAVILSERVADIDELVQAVYDAMDVNNATGVQLDTLCALVGVERDGATYSTVTLRFTGTSGAPVPAGTLCEGGGADGRARWLTTVDDVIGTILTVDIEARAEETGATDAGAGTITTIVTPVSGVTAVTNPAVAVEGEARETDAALRIKRAASLQVAGAGSTGAIRAAILALDFVISASVIDNDQAFAQVIQGKLLPANCSNAMIWPNTLGVTQQQEIIEAIYTKLTAGVQPYGTDVTGTATGGDGFEHTVAFDWATTITAAVDCTLILDSGYVLADVDQALEDLITAYFDQLTVGEAVYDLDINALAASIDGIAQCTTLFGGPTSVVPNVGELVLLGIVTIV